MAAIDAVRQFRNLFRRQTKPVDAFFHGHKSGVQHIHSYASHLHKHAQRATCREPECKSFPKHNVHNGPNIRLD